MGHTSTSSSCVTLDCVRASAAARQQTHSAAQHQEVLPALQVSSHQYSSVFIICLIKLYIVFTLRFTTLFLLHFSTATNVQSFRSQAAPHYNWCRRRSVKRGAADSDRERGGPPPPALLPAPSLLHRINLFVTSSEFLLSYTNICTAPQSKHGWNGRPHNGNHIPSIFHLPFLYSWFVLLNIEISININKSGDGAVS